MPSPFPGMDPFLEDPAKWGGVHQRLIVSISDYLGDVLSPHFVAWIEERVYIIRPDELERGVIVPDVYLVRRPDAGERAPSAGVITAPTLVEPIYDPVIHDYFIEIRDTASQELITTLEVLSPSNKTPNSQGREAFLHKRSTVRSSGVHWIEIDLLRAGERPPAVDRGHDYYVLLKRGRPLAPNEIWFFDLPDRLPTVAVPLCPPFEDVPLDLQIMVDTVYARGHYADGIDYTRSVPPPRLRPADAAWAAERVRAWQAAHATAADG